MIKLPSKSLNLLKKCLKNQKPEFLHIITSNKVYKIDEKLGDTLRNIIGDELTQYGISNGEINSYGIILDDLIDEIGRFYLHKKVK